MPPLSGALATVNAGVPIPPAPLDTSNPDGPASGYDCPRLTATDPTNHVAMSLYAVDSQDGSQATAYRTLLHGDSIVITLWDNQHHMYALGSDSKGAGKLWVYIVTSISMAPAPGSPYSIPHAQTMVGRILK